MRLSELPWLTRPAPDWAAQLAQWTAEMADAPTPDTIGQRLQLFASCYLDYEHSCKFGRTLRRLAAQGANLNPLRPVHLAVLSSHTMDIAIDALPAGAARHGVALTISTFPYAQVLQNLLDPQSALYAQKPDAVLLALDHHFLGWSGTLASGAPSVDDALDQYRLMLNALVATGSITAILQTIPLPADSFVGSHDVAQVNSLRHSINRLNSGLAELAMARRCLLLDSATLAGQFGSSNWFNPALWYKYKMPFDASATPLYADWLGRLLGAMRGTMAKCLVLDLDNTLWGGVIGDDGLEAIQLGQGSGRGEAHLALQKAALDLKKRGVFLAVASKNNEDIAREVFTRHPEMLLREQDIAIFCANWGEKSDSLESIASHLNIGIDALVFMDDNPLERERVRQVLPTVKVLELPQDPAWYAWLLHSCGYFEAITVTGEDTSRTTNQQGDVEREKLKSTTHDMGSYLRSLDMQLVANAFDATARPRIVQLINKTNQFNLTTLRMTEAEVETLESAQDATTFCFRLSDRFGDMGLIAALICKHVNETTWQIENWVMSCRVFGRNVEHACFAVLAAKAQGAGVRYLRGTYAPTAKNRVVSTLYQALGFTLLSETAGTTHWQLDLHEYKEPEVVMKIRTGME